MQWCYPIPLSLVARERPLARAVGVWRHGLHVQLRHAHLAGYSSRDWRPIALFTALLALAAQTIAAYRADLNPAWWWLPLAVYIGWVLPTAGAYWMTRDQFNRAK